MLQTRSAAAVIRSVCEEAEHQLRSRPDSLLT
jgi:hypothetical protein